MISKKGQLKISNVCYEHISTKFAMHMNPSTAEKTSHWIAGLISILSKVVDLNYTEFRECSQHIASRLVFLAGLK